MKSCLHRVGCQGVTAATMGLFAVCAGAQSSAPSPTHDSHLAAAANFQRAGELAIADRYGKTTRIDVRVSSPPDADQKTYTSGDTIDAKAQVTAVRMGEHIAIVRAGNLWRFPLTPNESGTADVEFDGVGIVTQVSWKVTTTPDARTLVEADVVIPTFSSGYSAQQARLSGVWRATFDATFPIPVRSELNARLNVRPVGNESTTVTWIPH